MRPGVAVYYSVLQRAFLLSWALHEMDSTCQAMLVDFGLIGVKLIRQGSSKNRMCISDVYAVTTLTSTLHMQRIVNRRLW